MLSEDDVQPFVLDKNGIPIKVNALVKLNNLDYRVTRIVGGANVDDAPLLELTRTTFRTGEEIEVL